MHAHMPSNAATRQACGRALDSSISMHYTCHNCRYTVPCGHVHHGGMLTCMLMCMSMWRSLRGLDICISCG